MGEILKLLKKQKPVSPYKDIATQKEKHGLVMYNHAISDVVNIMKGLSSE